MIQGWKGELVRLVPLERDKHFENALNWINDPEVTAWTLGGDFPISRLAEEEWFSRASGSSRDEITFAIETLDGDHIGFSGLHKINWIHGEVETGSLIGRKDLWGKGYGSDAAKVRSHYIFHVLGLRLARTAYMEGNEGSRRMQEKAGYVECGRWPKRFWKRGEHRDEVLMVLTLDRWLELNPYKVNRRDGDQTECRDFS